MQLGGFHANRHNSTENEAIWGDFSMKLFFVPNPWDYHEFGGYYVMAETPEAAIKKLKASAPSPSRYVSVKYNEIREVKDGIEAGAGCDD